MRDPFFRAIERHWREYRPKMVAGLEQGGLLEQAIEEAADRTVRAEAALMQQGVSCEDAQEKMRQEWAFLPAEEEQPVLPNGSPERWLQLECQTPPSFEPDQALPDGLILRRPI